MTPDPDKMEAALHVGLQMRRAQRDYFKLRTPAMLIRSKELEAQFDRLTGDALGIEPLLLP